MQLLLPVTALLILLASPVPASSLPARQLTVSNATLVYDNGGWVEFIRPRHNGHILLPYTNVPEFWSLDPLTGKASLLLNFTGPFTGLTGITEVQPDYFALLSGNFSTKTFELGTGSWGVWTVDFRGRGNKPPVAKFIQRVPESIFFLGTTKFDDNNIFISDGGQGLLYRMNLHTGVYSIVSQDITMNRNGGLAGVHGVQYIAPYVYYSNTYRAGYYKLLLSPNGTAIGSPIEISPFGSGDRLEGFARWIDGATYMGIQAGGIKKVALDGTVSEFVNVDPPTDCVFGRGVSDWDVLYISTAYGTIYKAPRLLKP